MKTDYYFKDRDAEFTFPLDHHLREAKAEGLKVVKLIKAEPDNVTTDYIYCREFRDVGEKSECSKKNCASYSSKSGRGVCEKRGKLFLHGEEVEFKI